LWAETLPPTKEWVSTGSNATGCTTMPELLERFLIDSGRAYPLKQGVDERRWKKGRSTGEMPGQRDLLPQFGGDSGLRVLVSHRLSYDASFILNSGVGSAMFISDRSNPAPGAR